MAFLSGFSFVTPWALSAFLLLPILWQLLRTTAPKPKVIAFPAVRLLQELHDHRLLAARTPWWLLILRSLIVTLLIMALAGPTLNAPTATTVSDSPHIIIVDNDWSVMDRWDPRKKEIQRLINQTKNSIHTTYLAATSQPEPFTKKTQDQLTYQISQLKAQPWPTRRMALLQHLQNLRQKMDQPLRISWIANGIKNEDDQNFAQELTKLGKVEYITENTPPPLPLLQNVTRRENGFLLDFTHLGQRDTDPIQVQFLDTDGNILLQKDILHDRAEANSFQKEINLVQELKSRTERLRLSRYIHPGAQYILDEKWRDQSVGIITAKGRDTPLLAPSYYVKKSLDPYTRIQEGPLNDLLEQSHGLLFDVTHTAFSTRQNQQLEKWIAQGGVFIRFAHSRKNDDPAKNTFDPLLPVQLMPSERTFGGSLSWDTPKQLAPFDRHSPFFGLVVPDDITINKQILARPDVNLTQKTWARLSDGTPLITANRIEKGWSILFHIEAVPGWSKLPLSGTFEQMMKRLLKLGNNTDIQNTEGLVSPYRLFDRNGFLNAPNNQYAPIEIEKLLSQRPDADHPPGLYGQKDALVAYNLGPFLHDFHPLDDLENTITRRDFSREVVTDLSLWFLFAAFILALIDWGASLRLRALVHHGSVALLAIFILHFPASAQGNDTKALNAANHMRLAYMKTQDAKLEQTLKRGLDGLGMVLKRRTAVELAPAMAYDPEQDDPSLFPMIYWAVDDNTLPPSPEAVEKLNRFLKTGGFLLIDTMGQERQDQLRAITHNLDISPLDKIGESHVLTRAFYLLQRFPGRFDFDGIWVESDEDTKNDRVSSVLIGQNAWVHAWARDDNLRPIYPVIPGGDLQREQANRFGVNLVMYILSGNYKGDQVHIPAILQRLGL